MGLPKSYKTNLKLTQGKIGPERRKQILDGIADKGTFLPKSVLEEDMDQSVSDLLTSDERFSLVIDGQKVPVLFLTIQRWTEFSKTWQHADKYKDIQLPFITIVRKPDIQQGQNQAGLWNIPGNQTYTYYKVPTFDGQREGYTLFKVPQPTSVDITYEIRLFTNRMKELNRFNRKFQRAFQSRQCYINVKGHPMPLHLENIGDESTIDDFENRRFYVQLFELKLLGYILDEEDFEVVPTINRLLVTSEIEPTVLLKEVTFNQVVNTNNGVTLSFGFKPRANSQFSFISLYNLNLTQLVNIQNITRITISINGLTVFDGSMMTSPIIVHENDTVTISVSKGFYDDSSFQLIGNSF